MKRKNGLTETGRRRWSAARLSIWTTRHQNGDATTYVPIANNSKRNSVTSGLLATYSFRSFLFLVSQHPVNSTFKPFVFFFFSLSPPPPSPPLARTSLSVSFVCRFLVLRWRFLRPFPDDLVSTGNESCSAQASTTVGGRCAGIATRRKKTRACLLRLKGWKRLRSNNRQC